MRYTDMLQETYTSAYVKPELGLTPICFSRDVFMSDDTQKYLVSNLLVNDTQKTWLAFAGKTLVGSITIVRREEDCEMRGFYVKPVFRGGESEKNYGLWQKPLRETWISPATYTPTTRKRSLCTGGGDLWKTGSGATFTVIGLSGRKGCGHEAST
jgi:hypothetical protein